MKPYPLIIVSVCLLMFFSCKKTDFSLLNLQQPLSNVVNGVGTVVKIILPLNDTLTPANAVSVKKYGALGNGLSDDTKAIQAAIDAENIISLPAGTYVINNTLNLRAGVKIYGSSSTVLKAGNAMKGTLLNFGRYFYIGNTDNTLITNITFQKSLQSFKLDVWANACIYAIDSKNTTITYNTFDFALPYAVNGLEAVWISGSQSENTLIKNNKLTSVGIEYAENGANSTTVDGNTITHAPSDGLSAHGNIDQYCMNNVVTNNTIQNSGFMGIEDYGHVDGTLISNNTITGTGKDPAQRAQGMGISVVGINTKVMNNKITDAQLNYIEAGNSQYIYGNIINDSGGKATGIIMNFTVAKAPTTVAISNVLNNTITGCATAILVFGDNEPNVNINSNIITNPTQIGISVDSSAPQYTINVTGNNISFNTPNKQIRRGFESYTWLAHGTGNQSITLSTNTLTYATSASGGSGLDYGFEIGTDNTVLDGNTVNGNNIKAGKSLVLAISGNSDPAYNITLTNNMVYNAIVNLQDFTINNQSGNNF